MEKVGTVLLFLTLLPKMPSHCNATVCHHTCDHAIEVWLEARHSNDDSLPLNTSPEGSIFRKKKVRAVFATTSGTIVPKLKCLTLSDFVVAMTPVGHVAK